MTHKPYCNYCNDTKKVQGWNMQPDQKFDENDTTDCPVCVLETHCSYCYQPLDTASGQQVRAKLCEPCLDNIQ